jgi:hypothetical protein
MKKPQIVFFYIIDFKSRVQSLCNITILQISTFLVLDLQLRISNKYGSVTALKQPNICVLEGGASNQFQRIIVHNFFLKFHQLHTSILPSI